MGMTDDREVYLEAEWGVLGALVTDADYCAEEILLDVSPDDFLHSDCRAVFEAARSLHTDGAPISRLSLAAKLPDTYHDFLSELEQVTPTATMFRASVEALRREARRKNALDLAQGIADSLRFGGDPDTAQPDAEKLLSVLGCTTETRASSLRDMAIEYFSSVGDSPTFYDWGFDKFNRMLLCRGGENIILAARPSVGKTALALQLAVHFAKKHRVAFYSMETDRQRAMERIMACMSMTDFKKIQRGTLHEDEIRAQMRVSKQLQTLDFRFVDAAGWTINQIRADAVRSRREIVFIDYLQLVSHSDTRINVNEYQRVTEVSRAVQSLAKNHSMMTVSLSQFSRGGDDTNPQLKDLRSSGQIEQDADVVAFLYRPPEGSLTAEELNDYDLLRVFKIAKNRNGELGRIPMWFQGQYQHFMQEWDHVYNAPEQDMPPDPPSEQMRIGGKAV